jgi:hypothetical protein
MNADIKVSLISLLDGIKRSDGQRVVREMAQLDAWAAKSGRELHPQLLHFLERRSYAKALAFLGGVADIPAGACGRGKP